MIYKLDVLSALKEAGYNTNRIRKEKLIGEAMLQKIRSGQMPSWATLETICSLPKRCCLCILALLGIAGGRVGIVTGCTVDAGVRNRTAIRRNAVRTARQILAVVPHHAAGAAIDVDGLLTVVVLENLRAVRNVRTPASRGAAALDHEHQNVIFIALADAGARIQL